MTVLMSGEMVDQMTLYRSEGQSFDRLIDMGDCSKRMLENSMNRTLRSYDQFAQWSVLKATGNFVLGRIESVVAPAIVLVSSSFVGFIFGGFVGPVFLGVVIPMNLFSRLPGVSYFQAVRDFTQMTSDAICRAFRVYVLALPIISLFVGTSCVNFALPGLLKSDNVFF